MKEVSKIFTIQWKDVVKGAIMAMLTVLITALYNALQAGELPMDLVFWKPQIIMGLKVAIIYLAKNFLTNSKDQFLKKE